MWTRKTLAQCNGDKAVHAKRSSVNVEVYQHLFNYFGLQGNQICLFLKKLIH